MKPPRQLLVSIEIDKLTNSIENVVTGDSFQTLVSPLQAADLKAITKKAGWQFDWKKEYKQVGHIVFKLTIVGNATIVQGLISLETMSDHIYMHLIENAPFNLGSHKMYAGVAGNLVAYACKLAFEQGYEGSLAFTSKTRLIVHYATTLGAQHIGGRRMFIDTPEALKLVNQYFTKH